MIGFLLSLIVSREEKSLGIMSQKFLMLFLTSEVNNLFEQLSSYINIHKIKDGLVSINFAARVLLGDTKNDVTELGKFKSKF